MDPRGATTVWQDLRDCARRAGLKDDAEALDALLGLAEVAEDHAQLVGLLDESASFTRCLGQKKDFLRRRAEIQAGAVGR